MNQDFLFKSIRKYNRAARQTQKDAILHAVGVHVELLPKSRRPMPTLSEEERSCVRYFLRQFLKSQNLEVTLKD